jgi:hypothetical protein
MSVVTIIKYVGLLSQLIDLFKKLKLRWSKKSTIKNEKED